VVDDVKNEEIEEDSGDVLSWRIHPFIENKKGAVMVIGFIMLFCGLIYFSIDETNWRIYLIGFSLVVFFITLSPFFFPSTFTLDENGVKIKRLTTIKRNWKQFRGFYYDKNGVQLTTFTYPSRLDSYRGLFLKFGENKEEVIDFIEKHLERVKEEKREESAKVDE